MAVLLLSSCGGSPDEGTVLAVDAYGPGAASDEDAPTPTVVPTRVGVLVVFLDDDASSEAVRAIRERIEQLAGAGSATFFDHEDAHAEFAEMFAGRKCSPPKPFGQVP